MILIDGSYGEGGGQVLRSSLSLSVVQKAGFKIYNIRKNRKKPGLSYQHLACVKAAKTLSKAEVEGDYLRSTTLKFVPKELPVYGTYRFEIPTAGSACLLFQTVLYPLAMSEGGRLVLRGGTHVPKSPSFHYLKEVFLPKCLGLGFNFELKLIKPGVLPKGGGEFEAEVLKWKKPESLPNLGRFNLKGFKLVGTEKEVFKLRKELEREFKVPIETEEIQLETSFVLAVAKGEELWQRAGFPLLLEKKHSKKDFKFLINKIKGFFEEKADCDVFAGDQVLLPLSLIIKNLNTSATYRVPKITEHLVTHAWVIQKFLPVKIEIKDKEVRVEGGA